MITAAVVIHLLILGLVFYLVYYIAGMFIHDQRPLQIIGLILALIFLLYALQELGIFNSGIVR